jgi:hypothetical protein
MNEMHLRKLSRRDLERLSAYLDGALNARQTARMDARLDREPVLRKALTELRQTAHLLRSMPQVAAPRHFTLTPEMVAGRKPHAAYPVLKLASALVAAAFVFVIGIDVFGVAKGSGEFPVNLAQRSVAEAPAMEADVAEEEDTAVAMEESEELADEEAAAPLEEPTADTYAESLAMEEGGEEPTRSGAEVPTEELGEPEELVPEEPTNIGKTVDEVDTVEGVDSEGETMAGEADWDGAVDQAPTLTAAIEDEAVTAEEEMQEVEPSSGRIEPVRILEIGLAILCIVLIVATLLLRASYR